jgi:uncharacterized protein YndB with AHSA1/START domain
MSTVHAQIEIDAPLERVWETVMDPQRLGDWVTIHRSVRNISDQPLSTGSTMDQMLHIHGVRFRVHWTLTDVSAPHHAEWEGHGPAHSRASIRYELSGGDIGPTRSSTSTSSHRRGAESATLPADGWSVLRQSARRKPHWRG